MAILGPFLGPILKFQTVVTIANHRLGLIVQSMTNKETLTISCKSSQQWLCLLKHLSKCSCLLWVFLNLLPKHYFYSKTTEGKFAVHRFHLKERQDSLAHLGRINQQENKYINLQGDRDMEVKQYKVDVNRCFSFFNLQMFVIFICWGVVVLEVLALKTPVSLV